MKQSRLLFKKEWVSILADAGERVGENEETFHEVEGELIEFRETSGIVVLKGGILASVPMYRIQMLPQADPHQLRAVHHPGERS